MPLYVRARIAPAMINDPDYKGVKLTTGNVFDLTQLNEPGCINMDIEHKPELHIGRWVNFEYEPSSGFLIGNGFVDERTPWGAYAIRAILEGKMNQFSTTFSCKKESVDEMARTGVKKQKFTSFSLCQKGDFDGTGILSVTKDFDPNVQIARVPNSQEIWDASDEDVTLPQITQPDADPALVTGFCNAMAAGFLDADVARQNMTVRDEIAAGTALDSMVTAFQPIEPAVEVNCNPNPMVT